MTAKRSPFTTPDVEGANAPVRARSRPPRSMSCGMPRFDANRFAVPAGMIASGHRRVPRARRRSAAPCRRRPRRRPARRHPSSARSTCSGANLLFGTSDQSGRTTPARRELAAQFPRPPPIDLPACAITATVLHRRRLPLGVRACAATARRARRSGDGRAPHPSSTPAGTSVRWCMPAVACAADRRRSEGRLR